MLRRIIRQKLAASQQGPPVIGSILQQRRLPQAFDVDFKEQTDCKGWQLIISDQNCLPRMSVVDFKEQNDPKR